MEAAAPDLGDLRAIQSGAIGWQEYRDRCEARWAALGPDAFAPGRLLVLSPRSGQALGAVEPGDCLCCSCAAIGSPARKHPCHLEFLAPHLARAGWAPALYGDPSGQVSLV